MKDRDKIKFHSEELPKIMYAVGYSWELAGKKKISYELEGTSQNFTESYIKLFKTQEEAQAWLALMNKEYNLLDNGEKVYWFKNRKNQVFVINTTLKKYVSKYMPLGYAMNRHFDMEYVK
jgi:hypothetical protein